MRLSAFGIIGAAALLCAVPDAEAARRPAARGDVRVQAAAVPYPPPRPGAAVMPMPPKRPSIAAVTPMPAEKPDKIPKTNAAPPPPPPDIALPEQDRAAAEKFAACRARLEPEFATITTEAPISGPGECGASDLVRLKSIKLEDGRVVTLDPAPKIRCQMAEAVTHWVRTDVAPLAARIAPLKRMAVDTSYECRNRNHASTGKISQHAFGNAIDIRALSLTNGKSLVFTDATADNEVRAALQASACSRFTTVLGPGSDGVHEDHIHLDIAERRGGYRLCQWDVRSPQTASDDKAAAPPASPIIPAKAKER